MTLTSAERQARFRAHKKGDHQLCDPQNECRTGRPRQRVRSQPALDESIGPGRGAPLPRIEPEPEPAAEAADLPAERRPAGPRPIEQRGERARQLWTELAVHLPPAHRVMLSEACRLVDRLDRLDAIIDGDEFEWLRFEQDWARGGEVVVSVDASLAEARQQATALRGLLMEIVKALPKHDAAPVGKGSAVASLAAAAARRRTAAR